MRSARVVRYSSAAHLGGAEGHVTRHDAERRQRILDCIARTVQERGYPPSVREIADAVGLASTSAVHHHLVALERDGLLERGTHSSRALRLTTPQEPVQR